MVSSLVARVRTLWRGPTPPAKVDDADAGAADEEEEWQWTIARAKAEAAARAQAPIATAPSPSKAPPPPPPRLPPSMRPASRSIATLAARLDRLSRG
jgi:hypothetical protein